MSTQGQKLKVYTEDFKKAAVARYPAENWVAIGKDLKITPSVIRTWKKNLEEGKPLAATKRRGKAVFADEATKRKALAMVDAGQSGRAVAKALNVGESAVYYWVSKRKKGKASVNGNGTAKENPAPTRAVHSCIGLLRQIKGRIDLNDPVHLTAMLVLQTLEGKM